LSTSGIATFNAVPPPGGLSIRMRPPRASMRSKT
jgi:hypothetical protein